MEGRQSVSVIPDIKIFINPLYCPTTVSETDDDEKEEHARRKQVLTKLFTNPLYFFQFSDSHINITQFTQSLNYKRFSTT